MRKNGIILFVMKDENAILQKRFIELYENSYQNSAYYFTDFLSVSEIALLYEVLPDKDEITLFGGSKECERQMARFGNKEELGYELEFPISIIKVEPLMEKFADHFTHRDFLGALMNLGIERDVTGDIWVKDKSAYLFLADKITDFVIENLNKVKHTNVKCHRLEEVPEAVLPKLEEHTILVSSPRIDSIVAGVHRFSRSQVLKLFAEKKVFLNGRLCESNSLQVKQEDIISVRGLGKFIVQEPLYKTKKEKLCLRILQYK